MWLKRFTHYLLQHQWQTLILIFLLGFVPVIGVIAIVFAALITLLKGSIEGALATLAATLPYVLIFLFYSYKTPGVAIHIWASLGVSVFSNIITYIFAVMIYRGSNWSVVLQVAALMGVFAISLIHFAYPEIADWWGVQLQNYYTQAQSLAANKEVIPSPEIQMDTINATKQIATGLMVAAILANAILQLVVARWWQAVVFRPGSLSKELHFIRLSRLAGMLFLVCLIFSYLGNPVVFDIIPVVYLLFFVAGLSIIHYFFGMMHSRTTWFWLVILYFTLLFSMPASIIAVSMLALIDIWWDARKRFKKA